MAQKQISRFLLNEKFSRLSGHVPNYDSSYHLTRASYSTTIIKLELLTVLYSYHKTRDSYQQLSSNYGFLRYSYHQTMVSYGTVIIKLWLPTDGIVIIKQGLSF